MTGGRPARTVPIPEPDGSRPLRRRTGLRQVSERGVGTVLVAGVLLVTMLVGAVLVVVAGYVAALHHARGSADLVALSAAAAFAQGQDACVTAGVLAAQNGVVLQSCSVRGDILEFAVSVTVSRRVAAPSPVLPSAVTASATAGRTGLASG
ncbi:MAG: flp pilus-assembly TadE/G-like family protein [Propionicimonas sp.]|uniref:Rv3654c family TadE-like protein n=1 Tax=Propionicimonas sp. TaxID=1955623 RepID=UPI003D103FAA